MQEQRSTSHSWPSNHDEVAKVILDIVLQRYPALVAIEELVRKLLSEPSLVRAIDEPLIHDALADLVTGGLPHRVERFVFPTLAIVHARDFLV